MNEDVKARWLTALRSGEYEQGKGQLRSRDDKYCCLGVLCDLWAKETETPWQNPGDRSEEYRIFNAGILPPLSVCRWAGIDSHGRLPDPVGPPVVTCSPQYLTALNDSGDYDFNQIADIIEAQL